jgi:hypothetical protein
LLILLPSCVPDPQDFCFELMPSRSRSVELFEQSHDARSMCRRDRAWTRDRRDRQGIFATHIPASPLLAGSPSAVSKERIELSSQTSFQRRRGRQDSTPEQLPSFRNPCDNPACHKPSFVRTQLCSVAAELSRAGADESVPCVPPLRCARRPRIRSISLNTAEAIRAGP